MSTTTSFGETRVNGTTGGTQEWPSAASLKDGGWVVTWGARNQDGVSQGIRQQRYDAKGLAIGDEVRVDMTGMNGETQISSAGLSDGGWVVTWIGRDGSEDGIFQQRYNAYGLKVGHDIRVNTTTASFQTEPSVTALAGGGWVVAWTSHVTAMGHEIRQQRYGANGFPIGPETVVDSYRYGAQHPSVTALSDGGWLVTYEGYGPSSDGNLDIFQQRYDADGWTVGETALVNTLVEEGQALSTATALKDGGWVVTWSSFTGDGSGAGIRQQRFAVNGQKVGAEVQVNTTTIADQFDSSVTALPDGGWLVTWTSAPSMTSPGDIYQQRYAADGQKIGGENRVNASAPGDQSLASVTVLKDGGWIVTWNSRVQDGHDSGIYQQRYTADGRAVGPTTPTGLRLERAEFEEGASGASSTAQIHVEAFVTDQGFTYTLLDNAEGRFALGPSGVLTVTDGTRLDYEQASSHRIRVEVTDKLGATHQAWLIVSVKDVVSESLSGTSSSDTIMGGSGRDAFTGGRGHDKLWGGLGNDTLEGGAGKDIFVFDTKPSRNANKDKLVDFKVADDTIWLDNKIFTKLGKGSESEPVLLRKEFFVVGSKAKDRNDYIVYDKAKGVLSYDADGSGRGKAVEFASLSKNLKITYKDFFVI